MCVKYVNMHKSVFGIWTGIKEVTLTSISYSNGVTEEEEMALVYLCTSDYLTCNMK